MRTQPTTQEIRRAKAKLKAKITITHKCLVRIALNTVCNTEHLGGKADLTGIKFNIKLCKN